MPKKAYIIALLLFAFIAASAQDTTETLPPCTIDNWPHNHNIRAYLRHTPSVYHSLFAKKFEVDSGYVTGIAAFVFTLPEDEKDSFADSAYRALQYSYVDDTAFNECYEYFGLYQRQRFQLQPPYNAYYSDSLKEIETAKMHVLDTNVIGYFDRNPYIPPEIDFNDARYIPIRAVYFEKAVRVEGEFWVGSTNHTREWYYNENTHVHQYYTWPLHYPSIQCNGPSGTIFYDTLLTKTYFPQYDTTKWNYFYHAAYLPIFPLFCELPVYPSHILDTVAGLSATVPVFSAADFVTLSPNPASTEVTVLSSTGFRQMRVYDIMGRPIYEVGGRNSEVGSQTSVVIPIAGWPNGIYTVHVDTPLGLAVKKLEKVE